MKTDVRRVGARTQATRSGIRTPRGAWLAAPMLVFLLVFAVFPLLLGAWISLTDTSIMSPESRFVGLDNYNEVLRDRDFWQALSFTVKFTGITTILVLITGFSLALLANRHYPGKRLLFSVLLIPIMVAPSLMGLMYRLSLNGDIGLIPAFLDNLGLKISLFDPALTVRLLYALELLQWTPFTFLILYAGLQSIPTELIEAAQLDGAGPLARFRHVILPLMWPVVFAAGFLRGVDALRTFDVIFVLTGGGPGRLTTSLSIYVYKIAFVSGNFGVSAAAGLLILLMILPIVPWVMRRVVDPVGA